MLSSLSTAVCTALRFPLTFVEDRFSKWSTAENDAVARAQRIARGFALSKVTL